MARLRTFIALPLPRTVRSRLVSLQERLGGAGTRAKWVEEENLHVTLVFLGEVEDRALNDVCRVVTDTCATLPGFPACIEGLSGFPNLRRPRTLWVGLSEGAERATQLHDSLETSLLELGCYRREEKQYTPHITLGRLKGEELSEEMTAALGRCKNWQAGEFDVEEVQVLSSELTSDGPIYTVLSRARLGGG
jgi:2'-5' RNA ligase